MQITLTQEEVETIERLEALGSSGLRLVTSQLAGSIPHLSLT